MKRRQIVATAGSCILLGAFPGRAQTTASTRRLGILATGLGSDAENKRFLEFTVFKRLQELGWTMGGNLVVDYLSAEGHYERLPGLAQQLVQLKPDVIFTGGAAQNLDAARMATSSVSIVMAGGYTDPVGAGIIRSLARPGGNITGMATTSDAIPAKRLQLLKECLPGLNRVGMLVDQAGQSSPANTNVLHDAAARVLKLELSRYEVRSSADFELALQKARAAGVEAIHVAGSPLLGAQHARGLAELLIKYKFPSMGFAASMADAGMLMGYGSSLFEIYNAAALYIDKIFRGASPAELPVGEPTRYELVVNLKTAKLLGVTIPPSLLVRADRVIE